MMISEEESFPKRSDRYLAAQDIFWTQFNEVDFYVEDKDQERFYLIVLRKIFPDISFDRIFPLNGKTNVLLKAENSLEENKKVFLLDLDFDEILQKKKTLRNVFYLRKYSIENYLLEEEAIYEIIREFKTKIKDNEISERLKISEILNEHKLLLTDLAISFLLIQKHALGIKHLRINPPGDISLAQSPACFRTSCFSDFCSDIEAKMTDKDKRLKFEAQVKHFKKYFKTQEQVLNNVPGKYILNIIKFSIERIFSLTSMTIDSFSYRLAKNCTFSELAFLKTEVSNYIG